MRLNGSLRSIKGGPGTVFPRRGGKKRKEKNSNTNLHLARPAGDFKRESSRVLLARSLEVNRDGNGVVDAGEREKERKMACEREREMGKRDRRERECEFR